MRRWVAALTAAVALALAFGAAACGSDDNGGVMEQPSTTTMPGPGRY